MFTSYDVQDRLLSVQLPVHTIGTDSMGQAVTGRDEIHFAYDLGRPAGKDICSAGVAASGSGQ